MLIEDKFSDILTLDDFDNVSLPEITRSNVFIMTNTHANHNDYITE